MWIGSPSFGRAEQSQAKGWLVQQCTRLHRYPSPLSDNPIRHDRLIHPTSQATPARAREAKRKGEEGLARPGSLQTPAQPDGARVHKGCLTAPATALTRTDTGSWLRARDTARGLEGSVRSRTKSGAPVEAAAAQTRDRDRAALPVIEPRCRPFPGDAVRQRSRPPIAPRASVVVMGLLTGILGRFGGHASAGEVASYLVEEASQVAEEAAGFATRLSDSKIVRYSAGALVAYKAYQLFFAPLRHVQRNHEVRTRCLCRWARAVTRRPGPRQVMLIRRPVVDRSLWLIPCSPVAAPSVPVCVVRSPPPYPPHPHPPVDPSLGWVHPGGAAVSRGEGQ